MRLKQDGNADWVCVIKIRRETSSLAVSNSSAYRVTADQKGDDRKPEVSFGKPINDQSLVEAAIRRAQIGILNPSIHLERFVHYKLPKVEETRLLGSSQQNAFSSDVIIIEITGPEVTDLTLVDLPGIISDVGLHGDKNSIKLVKDMVKSYISKECLILLVITMKGRSICLEYTDLRRHS